jgi:hypothetical protein
MFEYKCVKIDVITVNGKPLRDYKEIIHNHTNKGWRLHQVVSPLTQPTLYVELIFEKEIEAV